MAGPKRFTEDLVQARLAARRGQGEGEGFSPWQWVQEFSSRGTQTRLPPFSLNGTLKRTHHFFSYIERALYLYIDFRFKPSDYREQYAMDRAVTMGAAALFGIRHPRYPKTGALVVMTLDAVVETVDARGVKSTTVYDCKPEKELLKKRTMEKLSLHKAYCAHRGWPHRIITEKVVPKNVTRNLDWLRSALPKPDELEIVPGLFLIYPNLMLEDLYHRRPCVSGRTYCTWFDTANHLPKGTGLRLLKFLIWLRELSVDMTAARIELLPVPHPQVAPMSLSLRRAA